jgi:hypothetical protein
MEQTPARVAPPPSKPLNFWRRLKEIDMFFEGRGREHQAMRRLVRNLKKLRVPYAIVGGMAVNAHGVDRTTRDVDVLLTPEGFERFQQAFVGTDYNRVATRPRRFVDRRSGVNVDVLLTGRFPGSGRPGPIAFPDPAEVSEEIKKIHVLRSGNTRISRFMRLAISPSPASQFCPRRLGGTMTWAVMAKSGDPLTGAAVVSESADSMLIPRPER